MKKCLTVINNRAGSSRKISFEKVEECLGKDYSYDCCSLPYDDIPPLVGYDAIAICGGDGTLSSILEEVYMLDIDVFYFPVGTLNDKAKANRYSHAKSNCPTCDDNVVKKPIVIGKCTQNTGLPQDLYTQHNHQRDIDLQINNKNNNRNFQENIYDTSNLNARQNLDISQNQKVSIFTYVLACGSFTPIGYTAKVELKKKFGVLAYIGQVIKEYKPHRIHAKIDYDGKHVEGEFSLIMFLKSPRCFGFRFNRDFKPDSASGHLLAIRSPKHNGFLGCIEMFFPFFRTFFIGLKKEKNDKIIFARTYDLKLNFNEDIDFCKDGEKQTLQKGKSEICFKLSRCNFSVIEKF